MTVATLEARKTRTALLMLLMAAGALALGFAAVPLYRMFCQVTGFAGTTQRATESDADIAARIAQSAGGRDISIRFDSTVAPGLPWSFKPEQVTDTVTIGQRDMAIFLAENKSDHPITGTATFNVEPEQAGPYFNKIQCFCFTEQTLQPGQKVRMPVLYYVDPKALDDPNMDGVEQITLSYTFHLAKDQAGADQGAEDQAAVDQVGPDQAAVDQVGPDQAAAATPRKTGSEGKGQG